MNLEEIKNKPIAEGYHNKEERDRLIAEIERLQKKQRWLDEVGRPGHPEDERPWIPAYLDARGALEKAGTEAELLRIEIEAIGSQLLSVQQDCTKAEAELNAMIELEASVCPEDFGCHEYIPKLEARIKEQDQEIVEARKEGIDEMLKEVKHRAKMFSDGKRIYVGEEVLLQTFDLGAERLRELEEGREETAKEILNREESKE